MPVNRRTVTFAAAAATVLLAGAAGAARLALGPTPAGYESGYSPPDTVVLAGADGVTLRAGIGGCYEHVALQALERPSSVLLRVSWRTRPNCGFPPGWAITPPLPSLNLQVQLSAPLGGRRLVGPDGAALPRLDEAAMLRFTPPVQMSGLAGLRYRGPAYWYRQPQPPRPAGLAADRLFPTAKCLDTETTAAAIQLVLDQCAYGGARAGGRTAAAGSGVTLPGTRVTVRAQAGHVVEHRPGVPSLAGYDDFAWRALWWTEGHEVVVLISQRTASSHPALLSVPELVAVADDLWCVRRAACRSPSGHEPGR
jgi:hypothetical protein